MRRYIRLRFAIGFLVLALGCGEEKPKEVGPPKIISTVPLAGGIIASNSAINVAFDREMSQVEINVSGEEGHTHLAANQATWIPLRSSLSTQSAYDILSRPAGPCWGPMDKGPHTFTVTGVDKNGQELEDFGPVNFSVVHPDCMPPGIYGEKCEPANGAIEVDPERYREKLIVAFDEPMAEVKVFSTDPEFHFTAELSEDSMSLIISFSGGYTMPAGTKFSIELVGADLAGHAFGTWPKPDVYSFVTMGSK